jgi:hypothetical protein
MAAATAAMVASQRGCDGLPIALDLAIEIRLVGERALGAGLEATN